MAPLPPGNAQPMPKDLKLRPDTVISVPFREYTSKTPPVAQGSWSDTESHETMVLEVYYSDVAQARKDILGSCRTVFPGSLYGVGVPILQRKIPMQFPRDPWLFAKKVDITPFKYLGITRSAFGEYANYDRARLVVLFSTLPYVVLDENDFLTIYPASGTVRAEWNRYVEQLFLAAPEYTKDEQGTFVWLEAPPGSNQKGEEFQGSRVTKPPKGNLKWIWHNVPWDWVLDPLGYPVHLQAGLGCVNDSPFPPGADKQWGQGQLLFLNYKMTPHEAPYSPVDLNQPGAGFPPRIYDVEMDFEHFAPPAVSPPSLGHQLAPVPGYRQWAQIARKGDNTPPFDYYSFPNLFAWQGSLPP